MVVGTISLAAVAAVLAFATGGRVAEAPGFHGALRPPGIPPAPFTGLHDQDGRPVTLTQLRGRPAVVTFLYTTCQDTCPVTAQQIRGALDDLGHNVPVIAVSVDPAHDTPASARLFDQKQQMTGRMRWALGSSADLQRVWRAYGVQPETSTAAHSDATVLLDEHGRQRIGYFTEQLTPEDLEHDLALLEKNPAGT
jgi:protein SCO1/2